MRGIDGTYAGSCVVCMHGTDTGLAVRGPAEALAALLEILGLPATQASAMVLYIAETEFGCKNGTVPAEDCTWALRLCRECAAPINKSGMEPGLITTGIPVYQT